MPKRKKSIEKKKSIKKINNPKKNKVSIKDILKKPFSYTYQKIVHPTKRGRNWQMLIIVLLIAFFSFNLNLPEYWDQGADYLNGQIKKIPQGKINDIRIPDFYKKDFLYGLDLKGGIELTYKANFDDSIESGDEQIDSLEGIRDVVERRVNLFGIAESEVRITEFGQDKGILVSLPGVTDKEEAKEMIGETPFIDFREEKTAEEQQEIQTLIEQGATDIEDFDFNDLYYKKTELTGKHIKDAGVQYDQYTGSPEVVLVFTEEGKSLFSELTGRNVGKRIGIFLDNQIVSAPTVQEQIDSDRASITGLESQEEAETLKRRLNAGALPVNIELLSERSVDATLGEKVLDNGIEAGMWGVIAVIIFMILVYRLPGFLSSISLAIYLIILLALFKLLSVTLTLSGIAGIVFSIGIAVDANVLIFERMKEEIKKKRDISASVEDGFSKAWSSIRDSNVSTLIICLILFLSGASIMKGFAITLGIGVLVSMFSAIFVTRILLRIISGKLKNSKVKKYLY